MTLTRAWLMLLVLSAASTTLAASGMRGTVFVVLVLSLAGGKAHVILARYLGLSTAPSIRAGFDLALILMLIVFAVLGAAA
ncbi:hypothetical protein OEZ71_14340 [Defluviimonas sp. WL0050]|uniref:Cytochrome c oxidase subunit IV n=1 Tax=Albidovulum litorale TaxID=2984134 RepID=A0ABT2ZQN8_9RHOB|nr:hypothetical protein [Defluviimonas sp. WL0050]MCV2873476.1 hypothetical protein [Defluviimonas sp. WL0050]